MWCCRAWAVDCTLDAYVLRTNTEISSLSLDLRVVLTEHSVL